MKMLASKSLSTVWKNQKIALTWKNIRESSLQWNLVPDTSISRKFCKNWRETVNFWNFHTVFLPVFEHKFASSQSQCWWMRLGGSCKLLSSILSPKFSYKCLLRILHKGLKTLFKHKVCKLIKEQRAYKFSPSSCPNTTSISFGDTTLT